MKYYLVITLLLITSILLAQRTKQAPNLPNLDNQLLYFGYFLGINTMDYKIIHAKNLEQGVERRFAEVITLNPGMHTGMLANFRLNKYLNLRILPGIMFGQRDLLFINEEGVADKYPLELKSTYLECPLIIKFNGARILNAKPYFIGGVNFRYDLANSIKDGLFINSFDIYWELGAGIDSYMSTFKFSTEFKISVGISNILNPAGTGEYDDILYTKVLDKLFSRLFVLTFYIEGNPDKAF
jgi:hypothetical protein